MLAYYLVKGLSHILCLVPQGLSDSLGRGLALMLWPFVPKKRKLLAKQQIMDCLQVDEREAERIAKESTLRFGPMLFEVLRSPVIKEHMDEYVTLTGAVDELKAQAASGQGCVFATSHSGNWELEGGALAHHGIPLVAVAKKQTSRGMDKFINEYRALMGMHVTYSKGVREMYDMLGQGWFIGLLSDQDPSRKDGMVMDFFGRPTNCVVGAATMARFKDVPVFMVQIHKEKDGHHTLHIYPPLRVERTKNKKEDIRNTTQQLNHMLEEHIRRYPEDWFWLHDRWKSMREEY
ncbi:MAG: lysophospholipid acyltransferase family protein [Selenomonas sp.]|nr:lysophospholipid acyltransferase family protein [Selenomonas sp.]